jgi:hypothetical protein
MVTATATTISTVIGTRTTSADSPGGSETSSPTSSKPCMPAFSRVESEARVDGDLILEAIIMGSQRGGSDGAGGMKKNEEEDGECWEGFRVRWL